MGFSTGASSAKRKFKKAQANQYYEAFAKIKPIDGDTSGVETSIRRQLSDQEGLSARTKKLARQVDKAGREFKRDEGFSGGVSRFNKRYQSLQKQLRGQDVKRYKVNATPDWTTTDVAPKVGTSGVFSLADRAAVNSNSRSTGPTGLASFAGTGLGILSLNGKEKAKNTYYDSREEALSAAQDTATNFKGERPKSAPRTTDGLLGFANPAAFGRGQAASGPRPTAEAFVQEETLGGIPVGYRNLPAMTAAYDELNALGNQVSNSAGAKAADRYAALGLKLSAQLKKRSTIPAAGASGLLANELAGNGPLTEVIT